MIPKIAADIDRLEPTRLGRQLRHGTLLPWTRWNAQVWCHRYCVCAHAIHHGETVFWLYRQCGPHDACVYLCSPNEDFGRMNKRRNDGFRDTFQRFVAQIEYSRPWKVLRKSAFHLCSSFQNLRSGSIKSRNGNNKYLTFRSCMLPCTPNEDFRWLNETLDESFRSHCGEQKRRTFAPRKKMVWKT